MRRFKVKVNDEEFEVEVEEVREGGVEPGRQERIAAALPIPIAPKVTPKVNVPSAPAVRPEAKPAQAPASKSPSAAGEGAVTAPIPGVISQVKVSAGASVKKGQVLLYLEAMKMQNEILAPYDAYVKEVLVSQGAQVQTGDVLLKLDR